MLLRLKLNEAISRSFIWCIFSRWSFLESGRDGVGYDEKVIILKVVDTCKKRQNFFKFVVRSVPHILSKNSWWVKSTLFQLPWDIFSPSVIVRYLSWESGYLGTHCEIPTILGQVNLLWNKSDRGQNWQGDTKSIVECNDLLFVKVWGGDLFMATIKVEKYFFLYVGLLLLSQVSVSWLQKPHHCILHPKKHKIAKFHEN